MARNLNGAVRPAAMEGLLASVQDGFPQQRGWSDRFLGNCTGDFEAEPISARSHSVSFDATQRGRRSFVAHHEDRNAFN
jgi:hypothetical protein